MSSAVTATPRTSAPRIAAGVLLAAVLAVLVNSAIALLTVALGASDQFRPLQPSTYPSLTVAGILAGTAGWAAVRKWSRRPAAVLRVLVPAVVAVSLVPDLALLPGDMQPHTSGLAVVGLMVMHVTTAAVAVPILNRILPLPAAGR